MRTRAMLLPNATIVDRSRRNYGRPAQSSFKEINDRMAAEVKASKEIQHRRYTDRSKT